MTKPEIRQLIKRRKAACPPEERAALSAQIVARLLQSPRWISAQTILLYHSLPDEVNTHELIQTALVQGKRVLLPVVIGDDLELRELTTTLREGAFHILEPTGSLFTDYAAIDLAVIPGVAFTSDGCRLGRGRGYYDRLLARFTALSNPPYTLGLAFPFQLLDDLPTEPHDIRLNSILS